MIISKQKNKGLKKEIFAERISFYDWEKKKRQRRTEAAIPAKVASKAPGSV